MTQLSSPSLTSATAHADPAHCIPSERQLRWQQMECAAMISFGINTFTGREWGDGMESPALFAPSSLDCRQWARACRDAGMKMMMLVAKHHDGFCLWPSAYTEHTVKNSPWKQGQGDVVREFIQACAEFGLRAGIYLSPWDRHERSYGTDNYNLFFLNQMREVLAGYGPIAEVWFDGACGEGPNGKAQVYDLAAYYALIRELQPEAVIAICGPDVRWVGNESGFARDNERSVVAMDDDILTNPPDWNQYYDVFWQDGLMQLRSGGPATSREALAQANSVAWWPAECDVSIRPGWFYHGQEDDKLKSVEELLDIYLHSVGRNAFLLLNIPPDARGLLHEKDIQRLMELRAALDTLFAHDVGKNARWSSSSKQDDLKVLCDPHHRNFWEAESTPAWLRVDWDDEVEIQAVSIEEHIESGQRIESFRVEYDDGSGWKLLLDGKSIGAKRLHRFDAVKTRSLRLHIEQAPETARLVAFQIFAAS